MKIFQENTRILLRKPLFVLFLSLSLVVTTAWGKSKFHNLRKGVFLVATSKVKGSVFGHSVILIVNLDDKGALGVIINRSTDLPLSQVLPNFKGLDKKLGFGGPVSKLGASILINTKRDLKDLHPVFGTVYFSRSLETLKDYLSDTPKDDDVKVYAGYAGWAPGQLENEIQRGDWTVVPADNVNIFSKELPDIWRDLTNQTPRLWVLRHFSKEEGFL